MFNVQGSEMVFLVLIALLVLGPEKLPDAIRKAGRLYAEFRKVANGFQGELRSALDEPMREIQKTADMVRNAATFETAPAKPTATAQPASVGQPTTNIRPASTSVPVAGTTPAAAQATSPAPNDVLEATPAPVAASQATDAAPQVRTGLNFGNPAARRPADASVAPDADATPADRPGDPT